MKTEQLLSNSRAALDGEITPWGVFRVLRDGVRTEHEGRWVPGKAFCLKPGSPIWSEQLLPFGKGQHHVTVEGGSVFVHERATGKLVKTITHFECEIVDEDEYLVSQHGYLFSRLSADDYPGFVAAYANAAHTAGLGQRPSLFDNSPYVQIEVQYAGQTVIMLVESIGTKERAKVFTFDGTAIPSSRSYPLAYATWGEPEPEGDFDDFD